MFWESSTGKTEFSRKTKVNVHTTDIPREVKSMLVHVWKQFW